MFLFFLILLLSKEEDGHAFEPANKGMIFLLSGGSEWKSISTFFLPQASEGYKFSLKIHFMCRNSIKPLVGLDARFITWCVLTSGKWIS
jgi:hypothetical protein